MTSPDTIPESEEPELRLVIWPAESLKYMVPPFNDEQITSPLVKTTAEAMIAAMYKHFGVGLAAQQVGVPQQMFVMDANWIGEEKKEEDKHPRIFINPRVLEVGKDVIQMTDPGEGCLSFPYGYRSPVRRVDRVHLEWRNLDGSTEEAWFEDMESIIIKHEVDHLMGYFFI